LSRSSSGTGRSARHSSASGCTPIFTPDDPRLFDFVKTRRAVDYAPWQGMTIDSIRVVALPIFNTADPTENNAVYRLANRLHTETRPGILEKQLLIHPGEPLDVDRLRESERILRVVLGEIGAGTDDSVGLREGGLNPEATPNEEVARDADAIVRSARHLLELINDVLDLSKTSGWATEVTSRIISAASKSSMCTSIRPTTKRVRLRHSTGPDLIRPASVRRASACRLAVTSAWQYRKRICGLSFEIMMARW